MRGSRDQGSGFRGAGFRVQDLGYRILGVVRGVWVRPPLRERYTGLRIRNFASDISNIAFQFRKQYQRYSHPLSVLSRHSVSALFSFFIVVIPVILYPQFLAAYPLIDSAYQYHVYPLLITVIGSLVAI